MEEFKGYILGELSIPYYMAAGVFCLLTILIGLWMHSRKRDPLSDRTPEKFSWKFLIWDNTQRIAITMILMFLFFRFSPTIFGRPLSMELAAGVGVLLSFGLDYAIRFIQSKFDVLKMVK